MNRSIFHTLSTWLFLHLYFFLRWLRKRFEIAENFIKNKYENRLNQENKPEQFQSAKENNSFSYENTTFYEENEICERRHENKSNEVENSTFSDILEQDEPTDDFMKQRLASHAAVEDKVTERSFMVTSASYTVPIRSLAETAASNKVLEDTVTQFSLKESSAATVTKEDISIKRLLKKRSASNTDIEDTMTKYQLNESLFSLAVVKNTMKNGSMMEGSASRSVKAERVRTILSEIDDKDLRQMLKLHENSEELMIALGSEAPRSLSKDLMNSLHNNGYLSEHISYDDTVNVCSDMYKTYLEVFGGSEFWVYGLYVILIEQFKVDAGTKSDKQKNKLRISVVSSETFEEALRRSQIQTIELTYTNVFSK
ncbi:uncharacterized protein LOC123552054 [Mercenaria mercenaria]|uniref:uncharacterized protein LOC123552054 n=1 Tax=Mercenaria mercenaria TaxID=6596 RepID=UPI00234E5C06|nr:uncharacterized protein LOC123552054 [Mercenaria mercenaria]